MSKEISSSLNVLVDNRGKTVLQMCLLSRKKREIFVGLEFLQTLLLHDFRIQ